jgi:hypothetical protein
VVAFGGRLLLALLGAAGVAVFRAGRQGQRVQQLDGYGKDDGRVALARDRCQCLQVAELESYRRLVYDLGGLFERSARLVLSLGGDHLGARLSRSLGLGGHGTLQLHGQAHVFDFDSLHANSPTVRTVVQARLDKF